MIFLAACDRLWPDLPAMEPARCKTARPIQFFAAWKLAAAMAASGAAPRRPRVTLWKAARTNLPRRPEAQANFTRTNSTAARTNPSGDTCTRMSTRHERTDTAAGRPCMAKLHERIPKTARTNPASAHETNPRRRNARTKCRCARANPAAAEAPPGGPVRRPRPRPAPPAGRGSSSPPGGRPGWRRRGRRARRCPA